MNKVQYCYIDKSYYTNNPELNKVLDQFDDAKHGSRTHLFLNIRYEGNNILIPLRKKLGTPKRKFGIIGFSVPSASKPDAGLDYRYIMIINDIKYLHMEVPRISNKQIKAISINYNRIESEAIAFIKSYIRIANKNRIDRTPLFRNSSLINFHKELGIDK